MMINAVKSTLDKTLKYAAQTIKGTLRTHQISMAGTKKIINLQSSEFKDTPTYVSEKNSRHQDSPCS